MNRNIIQWDTRNSLQWDDEHKHCYRRMPEIHYSVTIDKNMAQKDLRIVTVGREHILLYFND
jgi:hypothetical protein